MTAASSCLDIGVPEEDSAGADGCCGVGSGVAGWIRVSKSGGCGGGGDGVGEWSGVIGLEEM